MVGEKDTNGKGCNVDCLSGIFEASVKVCGSSNEHGLAIFGIVISLSAKRSISKVTKAQATLASISIIGRETRKGAAAVVAHDGYVASLSALILEGGVPRKGALLPSAAFGVTNPAMQNYVDFTHQGGRKRREAVAA